MEKKELGDWSAGVMDRETDRKSEKKYIWCGGDVFCSQHKPSSPRAQTRFRAYFEMDQFGDQTERVHAPGVPLVKGGR